jgi:hypothetical protein
MEITEKQSRGGRSQDYDPNSGHPNTKQEC